MWRHLSSLSGKFGPKPPLVTRIVRAGLGTRLNAAVTSEHGPSNSSTSLQHSTVAFELIINWSSVTVATMFFPHVTLVSNLDLLDLQHFTTTWFTCNEKIQIGDLQNVSTSTKKGVKTVCRLKHWQGYVIIIWIMTIFYFTEYLTLLSSRQSVPEEWSVMVYAVQTCLIKIKGNKLFFRR